MSFDLIIGQDHVRVWLIFCISAFGRCEFWSKVNYYSRLMGNCFIKAPFPPTSYFSGIYASFTCVCVCVCAYSSCGAARPATKCLFRWWYKLVSSTSLCLDSSAVPPVLHPFFYRLLLQFLTISSLFLPPHSFIKIT
jgi:hypothetical protein